MKMVIQNKKDTDMTKEEQKLLTIDISARLPYGVKLLYDDGEDQIVGVLDEIIISRSLVSDNYQTMVDFSTVPYNYDNPCYLEYIKPYLRPMSRMTADEEEQWEEFMVPTSCFDYENNGLKAAVFWDELCNAIDWLNSHHLDYRGLIGKGLALQAPEDMYNFK